MPRITTSLRRAVISGDEEEEQREGGLARIESDEEESANYRTPIKKRKTRAHRDSLGQADENSDEEDKVRLRRKRDRNSDSGSHSNSIQTTPNKMSSDTRSLLKYQGTYYRDEYGGDLEDEQDAEDEEELESFIVSDDASIDEEEDEAEAEEEEEHEIGQGEMEEEENSDEVDSGNGNASKRKAVRILEDEEEVQESDARGVGMDQAQLTGGQEPREQPTEMARADGPQWDSNANEERAEQGERNEETPPTGGQQCQEPLPNRALTSAAQLRHLARISALWTFAAELVLRVVRILPKSEASQNGYPPDVNLRFFKALLTNDDGVQLELQAWWDHQQRIACLLKEKQVGAKLQSEKSVHKVVPDDNI